MGSDGKDIQEYVDAPQQKSECCFINEDMCSETYFLLGHIDFFNGEGNAYVSRIFAF